MRLVAQRSGALGGGDISLKLRRLQPGIDFHFDKDSEVISLKHDVDPISDVGQRANLGRCPLQALQIEAQLSATHFGPERIGKQPPFPMRAPGIEKPRQYGGSAHFIGS